MICTSSVEYKIHRSIYKVANPSEYVQQFHSIPLSFQIINPIFHVKSSNIHQAASTIPGLRESGVVLSVVLVAIRVVDCLGRAALREGLACTLAVDVVIRAGVLREVRGLVNESSTPGVGTGVGSIPEGTAEGDVAEAASVFVSQTRTLGSRQGWTHSEGST